MDTYLDKEYPTVDITYLDKEYPTVDITYLVLGYWFNCCFTEETW